MKGLLLTSLLATLLLPSGNAMADYIVQDLNAETTAHICGDKVVAGETLTLLSNGGMFQEAYKSGLCVKEKKLKMKVMKANSAAPFFVFFSDDICMFPSTDIGIHTPYTDIENVTIEETREILKPIIGTLVNEVGVPLPVTLEFIAYMFMYPSKEMGQIPRDEFSRMLGDKYKGLCKD